MTRISTVSPRRKLPAADEMAFGIVVSESNGEITGMMLEEAVRTLREAGCPELNIQIKYVPELFDLAMGAQFFAEYTDVDAVLMIGCRIRQESPVDPLQGLMQSVVQIQAPGESSRPTTAAPPTSGATAEPGPPPKRSGWYTSRSKWRRHRPTIPLIAGI